jgi:histidyl-tRNA synthetase
MELVTAEGSSQELLEKLEELAESARLKEGIRELRTVVEGVEELGVPESHFKVDLSIARGLDYYTGTVYETILTENPALGSVCSGGRYEDLASFYTKSRLPGVGISIGATRLFDQLKERLVQSSASLNVLIARFDGRYSRELAVIGQSLREAGLKVEVVQEDWKPKKQLQYADRVGVPYVIILGERELEGGVVALKDTRTGKQETVTREQLATTIKEGL